MNFANWLPARRRRTGGPIPLIMILITMVPHNPPNRFFPNHSRSSLRLLINNNLIRPMDLVVTQHPVLQHEPPRPPSPPVIHPLVQNPRNPVPHYVVNLQFTARVNKALAVITAVMVVVAVGIPQARGTAVIVARRRGPRDRRQVLNPGQRIGRRLRRRRHG